MKPLTINLGSAFQFQVLFEDESIFALHKPHSLHSVIVPGSLSPSVAEKLLEHFPELDEVAEKAGDAGLVNRLDFETTGVLIGAKSREIWQRLSGSQAQGKVKKSYLVIIEGELNETLNIRNYLGSRYRSSKKVTASETSKPRMLAAESVFSPVAYNSEEAYSIARVTLTSARRHQVRAHASGIRHPLVGDKLYGSKRELKVSGDAPPFALHAESVTILHPFSGSPVVIRAESPRYFLLG